MARPPRAASSRSPSSPRLGALLARVGAGDRVAFAVVYDRIAAPVFRLARDRGLPEGTCEILVEDVLLRIWRTAPAFAHQQRAAGDWTLAVIDDALLGLAGRSGHAGSDPPRTR